MQLAGSGSAIGPARFDHATAPSTMTPDAGWPGLRPARRRAKDAPTIGGCGDAGSRRKASDGRSRLLSEIPLGDKWCRCPACAKRIGTRMAPIGVYINVRPSAEALQTNTAHLSLTDVTVFSTQGNQGSMRGRARYIIVILVVLWLAVGVAAAFQRGYFQGSSATCAQTSTILVTVLAGPLNYVGVNPTIDCTLPQPSQ